MTEQSTPPGDWWGQNVGQITLRGTPIGVTVSQSDYWTLKANSDTGELVSRGSRFEDVKKDMDRKIRGATRKNVSVPYKDIEGNDRIALGFWGGDRHKIRVWSEDGTDRGKTEVVESWSSSCLVPDIPAEELERYKKTLAAMKKANLWMNDFRNKYRLNLSSAVENAIYEVYGRPGQDGST